MTVINQPLFASFRAAISVNAVVLNETAIGKWYAERLWRQAYKRPKVQSHMRPANAAFQSHMWPTAAQMHGLGSHLASEYSRLWHITGG